MKEHTSNSTNTDIPRVTDSTSLVVHVATVIDLLNGRRERLLPGDIQLFRQMSEHKGVVENTDGTSVSIYTREFADDLTIMGTSKIYGYTVRNSSNNYIHLKKVLELLNQARSNEIQAREIEIEQLRQTIEWEEKAKDNIVFYSIDTIEEEEPNIDSFYSEEGIEILPLVNWYKNNTVLVRYSSPQSMPYEMHGQPWEWSEKSITDYINKTSVRVVNRKKVISSNYENKAYIYRYAYDYLVQNQDMGCMWIRHHEVSGKHRWMSKEEFYCMIKESRSQRRNEILSEKENLDKQLELLVET